MPSLILNKGLSVKKNPLFLFLLIFSLTASACNLGSSTPQEDTALATSAAQTIEALLTAAPQATTTPPIGGLPPNYTPPAATPAASCEQNYLIDTWLRDNKIYDKAETEKALEPGTGFVMTWKVNNTGPCVWDDTYRMVYDSGERLSTQDSVPVMPNGYTVKNGETLTINIQMVAPKEVGKYESTYKLVDGQGNYVFFLGIITTVGSPSSSNASLAAPGDLRYEYDCSGGITRISLFWKDKADNEEGYRVYRDGEKVADLPAGTTSYDDIAPAPGSYAYSVAAYNTGGESPTKVQAETSACQ